MMRNLILAGAAALTLAAVPQMSSAQNTSTAPMSMSAQQRSTYGGWPADQRSMYDRWPSNYQSYYWTLSPSQQQGWWRLTDEQRAMVYGMTPEQRTSAWQSIESQMGGASTGMTAQQDQGAMQGQGGMGGQGGMSGNMGSGNMGPPPADSMNRSYPVCTRRMQDNCQNPGEGGARGRSRALPYWPGRPRSER
jgi:hypothetical protein